MSGEMLAAAILAGGHARRFGGRDKSRLIIEGRPIIVRQVEVLQRLASEVFIVASDTGRFADLGVPVFPDLVPNLGAIGGLDTALHAAAGSRVLVVACDMPFLDERVLSRLAALPETVDAAWVRTPRGVEPLLACYRPSARAAVRQAIDARELKVADLDRMLRLEYVDAGEIVGAEAARRLVTNLNTPGDYAGVTMPDAEYDVPR
jgi:molybdopterin-guanine dinucleotide biosynthesis protein A